MNTTEKLTDMLFEARRDISRMERNLTGLAQVINMCDDEVAVLQETDVRLDALAQLIVSHDGGFLSAIRTFRSITGLGLRESKDCVEKAHRDADHHGGGHSGGSA